VLELKLNPYLLFSGVELVLLILIVIVIIILIVIVLVLQSLIHIELCYEKLYYY